MGEKAISEWRQANGFDPLTQFDWNQSMTEPDLRRSVEVSSP